MSPHSFQSPILRALLHCAMALAVLVASAQSPASAAAGDALMKRGAYLTAAGDCAACHTAKGGEPFAGGLYMPTPFGELSTPNITPDRQTGIGSWTDEQFYRAMHDGIGHKGEYLYPVMPFPWYTKVTRDDVAAIRAYLNTVPAVNNPREPNRLTFPANIRSSLLAWRGLFFEPRTFEPDPGQSDQVNRGDYLVNGLAHCGECHNGRPALGATSSHREALAGGVIDNWYAPNISSDARDGIGSWSNEQIATYLKTGVSPSGGVAAGPMAETVHSLGKLTDDDLRAIAAYLKTTQPRSRPEGQQHALFAGSNARGGGDYLNFCASCHGLNGEGLAGVVPALNANGAVKAHGPQDVINVVLGGLQARQGYAPMLAIGAGMSDAQIADVTNYVRQNWDNKAPPTAQPGMVAALRADMASPMNPASEKDCADAMLTPLAARIDKDIGVISGVAGMPSKVSDLVRQARRIAPNASRADLVNGLTAGYCRTLVASGTLESHQRALQLGQFSELAYSAASGQKFK